MGTNSSSDEYDFEFSLFETMDPKEIAIVTVSIVAGCIAFPFIKLFQLSKKSIRRFKC